MRHKSVSPISLTCIDKIGVGRSCFSLFTKEVPSGKVTPTEFLNDLCALSPFASTWPSQHKDNARLCALSLWCRKLLRSETVFQTEQLRYAPAARSFRFCGHRDVPCYKQKMGAMAASRAPGGRGSNKPATLREKNRFWGGERRGDEDSDNHFARAKRRSRRQRPLAGAATGLD